jgi:hypothetical protein
MKGHLLYPARDFDITAELPAGHEDLIQDLELATVLHAMSAGDKFLLDVCTRVMLAGLTDPAVIRYRQEILADCVAEPEIIREMYSIATAALLDRRKLWGFGISQHPTSILAAAIRQLEVLIVRLRELRQLADKHADTFRSAGLTALFRGLQLELDDDYFETLSRHLKQLRFGDGELISAELDRDTSSINFMLRLGPARRGWKERVGIEPRSSYSFTIPPRDEAGANALADMADRGINQVASAAAQSADHVTSYFTMLTVELGFYVSCLNLRDRLAAAGQTVAFPEPTPADSGELSCVDLRDTSLGLRIDHVVGNDVNADGQAIVIITGANSGGKSTFLRSVGLAQLMMQCGMYVTAGSYRASVRHGIFTHFIREEDPDMVSGRLDEELGRLSQIVDRIGPRCLVLFNESFAATNEREGSEIARQVVRALLEANVMVLFVTHQFDFADRFRRQAVAGQAGNSALFLRAGRQPDGRRDFKLQVADPLPTSYGEDIYLRIGGWL